MDGARQIVTPAFVSLLCICIVFVPMFFLEGVARYLFVPMAEAVVFAMIASFFLSRTLVPTMANYLLRPHAPHADDRGRAASRNPLVRAASAPSRPASSEFAASIASAPGPGDGAAAASSSSAFSRRAALSTSADALSRTQLLSVGRRRPDPHACAARVGTRVEESARQFSRIEAAIRADHSADQLDALVDNIGMPVSGINLSYNNTGVIGSQDGDIQITLTENHRPTADYVRDAARTAAAAFPGVTFAFLPADIISQILNFGAPAPIDVQIAGADLAGELRLRRSAAAPAASYPRPGRRAHPAVARPSRARRRRRPHPRAATSA